MVSHTIAMSPRHLHTSIGIPSGPIALPPFQRLSNLRFIDNAMYMCMLTFSVNLYRSQQQLTSISLLFNFSKHIAMHQDGELPPGHILFEQFAKDHPLITDGLLCTGRTCPKMTDLGRRILSSAHQDVIEWYYQNLHLGGNFLVSDLVVSEERKLYIRTRASAFSSTENKVRGVLLTLRRLHRHLLPFFLWDRKYALFVSHLSKFVKSPPR